MQDDIRQFRARKQHYQQLQQTLATSGERQISLTDPDSRSMPVTIVRALVEHALQPAALATSPPASERLLTPGERLTQLITRLVEHRRDRLELFQLLDQLLSTDKAPNEITELIRQQRAAFLDELRQLIVAGQASGEVAAGEPDQLVLAIAATLEGLTRFGLHDPELFISVVLNQTSCCASEAVARRHSRSRSVDQGRGASTRRSVTTRTSDP